jgi:Tol biopolymer transport system component
VPSKPCPPPDYCVHLEDHRAGWSPDGKQLVFERIDTSTDPERAAIFTIGIGGKHLRQVTPWTLDGNDPDWSPDGTLIVFNATAEPSPSQNIYTIHPDGTSLKQLTSGLPAFDDGGQSTFHPSWSPDGTQILFSHSPARADDESSDWGFVDLFVMNRAGSDLHVLAQTALHENHAFWGPGPQS